MTDVRICFTGDREWTDWAAVVRVLESYPRDSFVISGGARGLDTIAEDAAKAMGFSARVVMPADWDRFGRSAGPIRNRAMLEVLRAGAEDTYRVLLAFHDDLTQSKGTKDMVKITKKAGISVKLYRHG